MLVKLLKVVCKLTNTPFSHFVFLPLVDKVVNAKEERKKWSIITLVVFWFWYLCKGDDNKFVKKTGGIGTHLIFMFASNYLVSKLTNFEGVYRHLICAVLSYGLSVKLYEYTSFVIPIVEVFGNLLNPLMYLPIDINESNDDYDDDYDDDYNDDNYDNNYGRNSKDYNRSSSQRYSSRRY